jgi:hypothetical protein
VANPTHRGPSLGLAAPALALTAAALTRVALAPVLIVAGLTHALRDRAPTARAGIPAFPIRLASVAEVMEAAIPVAANPTLRGFRLDPAHRGLVVDV